MNKEIKEFSEPDSIIHITYRFDLIPFDSHWLSFESHYHHSISKTLPKTACSLAEPFQEPHSFVQFAVVHFI